ncbi:hypothetical protein [Maribacter sp. 4G9]|uniref:hypothetical protein n=1 Tax=Maribacter sp. 4G9 TaxID=1889777 RepID=UPI0013FDC0B0|nr:hypothetical protein [Maribacter sp. 4G9]
MKKIVIALMAIVFNTFLFSCTSDSIAEEDTLYDIRATEGDDGQVEDDRGNG